ncbi:neuropilin-1a-like [Pocillopora verrucosa]|uniref:neuropilin-1a-like n=1 Tax=Pocillopora verrucosa TaxID=203993 RepID=UPI00333E28CF
MEIRFVVIHLLMWCIIYLKGISIARTTPILNVQVAVDDSEPLFQGNKTKVNVNVTHNNNSTSALNRLELGQQFSYEVVISIDPQGLTEPGRLHVAYVISTITYSGEYDNFTDPNNGTRLTKTSDNFHTSFYFYVPDSPCVQPLGMRSGYIKESQLLSSSFFKTSQDSPGHSPHRARLGSSGHWSPADGSASIDREQFILINSERFIRLKMGLVNVTNGNAAIPTAYRSPTSIRFLRIQPTSWHKGSALRIEVYGCYINETAPTKDRNTIRAAHAPRLS